MHFLRVSVLKLMAIVLISSFGFAALRYSTPTVAAVLVLSTFFSIGLAILAAVYRRESQRAFWLGFALMGLGYLCLSIGSFNLTQDEIDDARLALKANVLNSGQDPLLVHWLVTTTLLDSIRSPIQASRHLEPPLDKNGDHAGSIESRSSAIYAALGVRVPLRFATGAKFSDVMTYIRSATTSNELPEGIPFYVDPVALSESGRTMDSPIRLELVGLTLDRSLKMIVEQLDLGYFVDEGLVKITARNYRIDYDPNLAQSFRRVGHCLFALTFALIGGFAAELLYFTRPKVIHRPTPGSAAS